MSILAQEESRSISENVTWGHRKRFADGKIMVPYASLLGCKKGEDGNLAIDETQAPIVRRIYARFLEGASPQSKLSLKASLMRGLLLREGSVSGERPLFAPSLSMRNTKVMPCCKRASPPTF